MKTTQEAIMNRARLFTAVILTTIGVAAAAPVHAQESVPGPGAVVITVIPGGATFFTEGKDAKGPSFGNYGLGAGIAVNFNRYIGAEGEVSGAIGVTQDLTINNVKSNLKTPNLLNYTGNLVVSAPLRHALVPYATGGVGGLTLFDKASLGINDTETFLTGNVGGGLKWFHGRWGLRGDYRFIAVRSKDDVSSF